MSNHAAQQNLDDLHQEIGDKSGKGCLTRHQRRRNEHPCSHQWHAQVKTEENPEMYNYPQYKALCDGGKWKTGARFTKKRKNKPSRLFPPGYHFWRDSPNEGEWDVRVGRNFNHYLHPWWHNSHHIIPNSTLRNAINKAADEKGDATLVDLIKIGLLKGQYNLNDKVNMINLPMGQVVSDTYGLPRHIKGHQGLKRGDRPQYMNHPDYNRNVQRRITKVMDNYASLFDEEDHPEPPDSLSADELDAISIAIFEEIKTKQPLFKSSGEAFSLDDRYPDAGA